MRAQSGLKFVSKKKHKLNQKSHNVKLSCNVSTFESTSFAFRQAFHPFVKISYILAKYEEMVDLGG